MKVEAILAPAEIDLLPRRDLSGAACVVFDVLRATSSIVTGLAHGMKEVFAVSTIEEARELKKKRPEALMGGERFGERIEGFDLGNSPLEYCSIPGRSVIMTTTNGTVALRACAAAGELLVASLLNLDAVAKYLNQARPERVLLVCAGTFRNVALEDVLAAGLLSRELEAGERSDSALIAEEVSAGSPGRDLGGKIDYFEALRNAENGRALIGKGREEEVAWCARRSVYDVIGVVEEGTVRRFEKDGAPPRFATAGVET